MVDIDDVSWVGCDATGPVRDSDRRGPQGLFFMIAATPRATRDPRGAAAPREDAGRPARRAFTLVELLAVVAIIGVLVALLLPAVQAAREAARRTSCSNNLAQQIIAMHHYESSHQLYPPGTVNPTGPILNQLKGYHHGWIEQLLPYLEQEAVYHHIDRDVSVYARPNRPVRNIGFSWLKCPSSPQVGTGYSNYAALHHDVEASIDVDQHGVFFLNSAVTQDDVSDGVGYTIFLGEKVTEAGDLGWMSGTRAILRNTGEAVNTATILSRQTRRWGSVPSSPPAAFGLPFEMGAAEPMMSEPASMGGTASSAGDQAEVERDVDLDAVLRTQGLLTPRTVATFVGGFASFHPGGANFAMGDGSTRFIASTIALPIYHQLGHRADGELVELEQE